MKYLSAIIVILMLAAPAYAATLTRSIADTMVPGSSVTVTLTASGLGAGKEFTLEETLPTGLTISDWSIMNAQEAKSEIKTRQKGNSFGWSFTTTGSTAAITYSASLSSSSKGSGEFSAVYFDENGFNKDVKTVRFEVPKPAEQPAAQPAQQPPASQPPQAAQPEPQQPPQPPAAVNVPKEEKKTQWWPVVLLLVILALGVYFWYQVKSKPKKVDFTPKKR